MFINKKCSNFRRHFPDLTSRTADAKAKPADKTGGDKSKQNKQTKKDTPAETQE